MGVDGSLKKHPQTRLGCEADSGRIWKELHKRLVRTRYQQISLIQLSFSFRFFEILIDFPLSGYGTKYQSSKNTANKIGGHPEPPQPWESEAEPAEERPWYVPIPRASGYRVQSYRSFKFNQVKTPLIRVKSHFVLVKSCEFSFTSNVANFWSSSITWPMPIAYRLVPG